MGWPAQGFTLIRTELPDFGLIGVKNVLINVGWGLFMITGVITGCGPTGIFMKIFNNKFVACCKLDFGIIFQVCISVTI